MVARKLKFWALKLFCLQFCLEVVYELFTSCLGQPLNTPDVDTSMFI